MSLPAIHLAQGDTACGLLRKLQLPVHAVPEDLSHGPLDDGRRRMAYMKACCRCFDRDYDPDPDHDDAFWPWHALQRRLDDDRPEAVVLWHSGSAADYVFLRMAAAMLSERDILLEEISVPPRGGWDHGIAIYGPRELAPLLQTRRMIESARRASLAHEFLAIQARPEPLRRFDGEKLQFLGLEARDEDILAACGAQWTTATRVIARVWSDWRDGRNWPSDIFIAARLSALIDAGRLEAKGDRASVRLYRVRRSHT